jgi:hypothetical protein
MWLMGDADHIAAALEHVDRVCHFNFNDIPNPLLEGLAAATNAETFPCSDGPAAFNV